MTIGEFVNFYKKTCHENKIEVQDSVLNGLLNSLISISGKGHVLNLGTQNITIDTCIVLGDCFRTLNTFEEIWFADCMLPEDGLKALINGLVDNKSCHKLILKGNNLRGNAAENLGRLLKYNQGLKCISLEWNQLGLINDSFVYFCDGLSTNTSLEMLDLRNNQLSHENGKALAKAIAKNKIIRHIDARWNNFGIIGGRAFIEAMNHNKTLSYFEIGGNSIPEDLAQSLIASIKNNSERLKLSSDFESKTALLARQIQRKEYEKKRQVDGLKSQISDQEAALLCTSRNGQHRIAQLHELLEERRKTHNHLAARLSMAESQLVVAESKSNELQNIVTRMLNEKEIVLKTHSDLLSKEKDERMHAETKLVRENTLLTEKNIKLENKNDDAERQIKIQKEQIYDLKEQIAHAQADLKIRQAQLDERLQAEKQKNHDEVLDITAQKEKEILRIRQEMTACEKLWQDRVSRLETQRSELEEELGRQRNILTAERLRCEEFLVTAKARARAEEESRTHEMMEKMRTVQSSRDELASQCQNQAHSLSELQSRCATLQIELDSVKRKSQEMQMTLAGKDAEMMAQVTKAQQEFQTKLSRLEAERTSQQELVERLEQQQRQIKDLNIAHSKELSKRDEELKKLHDKLRSQEMETQRLVMEEQQRASILQAAIMQYVRGPQTVRSEAA